MPLKRIRLLKRNRLLKRLAGISVIALLAFAVYQTAYAGALSRTNLNEAATVNADVLNVRAIPGFSGEIVGQLISGSKITIQAEQDGWAKITASSGIQGWVSEDFLIKHSISSQGPLSGKTIVLDPGHGGNDGGTSSIAGTNEKTLTLETAEMVKQKLENAGANVIMTRTNDDYVGLQDRTVLSNENQADAFISFHYNWSDDPSANGLTSFYYQDSSNPLAADILNEVVKTTGLNNLGTSFDDLHVLRNNTQPSTLIELGFLSNSSEDSVVESSAYRYNVAQGVYQGLLDYFSNK